MSAVAIISPNLDSCIAKILNPRRHVLEILAQEFRGRLKHGRHFTFKSVLGDVAITFVNPSVLGSFVDQDHPFAAHGPWLQVLITEDFLEQMIKDFDCLSNKEEMFSLPKIFRWPNQKLMITIFADDFC